MLNELVNNKEIRWLLDRANIEVFNDLKEYSFNGFVSPYRASLIDAVMRNETEIVKVEDDTEKILRVEFGNDRQTRYRVMFLYTEEKL